MARTGPKPRCECGDFVGCRMCRARERWRRAYYRLPPLEPLPTLRAARLRLPRDERIRAYIAGILDGEGCITRTNGKPVVQVGMTDEPVIRWLAQIGGTVRAEQPPGNRKTLYRWRVMAGNDVRLLLRAVHPYMRVKQQQAENAIVEIEGEMLVRAGYV